MAKVKTIDTTSGTRAYQLATQYHAELDPRLPSGLVATLAADLKTLGADPAPATPPPPPPPSLPDALSASVTLLSAVSEAIHAAGAKPDVRKAYGVSGKGPKVKADAVAADMQKFVTRAQANPSEALSLGILPSDVTALEAALANLKAAEAAATSTSTSAKATRAAEARMHEAVTRIAGAGVLAFATNAAVRAQFAGLKAGME